MFGSAQLLLYQHLLYSDCANHDTATFATDDLYSSSAIDEMIAEGILANSHPDASVVSASVTGMTAEQL